MSAEVQAPAVLSGAEEHTFAYLKKRADVLACCADTKNLVVRTPMPNVWVAHCTRCGRRHRKMRAEPGSVFGRSLEQLARAGKGLILPGSKDFNLKRE